LFLYAGLPALEVAGPSIVIRVLSGVNVLHLAPPASCPCKGYA
jgi:hypothetical protein